MKILKFNTFNNEDCFYNPAIGASTTISGAEGQVMLECPATGAKKFRFLQGTHHLGYVGQYTNTTGNFVVWDGVQSGTFNVKDLVRFRTNWGSFINQDSLYEVRSIITDPAFDVDGTILFPPSQILELACAADFCCVYQYAMPFQTVYGSTAQEANQLAYDEAQKYINLNYPGMGYPTYGRKPPNGPWTQEASYSFSQMRWGQNPIVVWKSNSPLYETPECRPRVDGTDGQIDVYTAPFAFPKDDNCDTTCPACLLYTSPSPRDGLLSRMPSSA